MQASISLDPLPTGRVRAACWGQAGFSPDFGGMLGISKELGPFSWALAGLWLVLGTGLWPVLGAVSADFHSVPCVFSFFNARGAFSQNFTVPGPNGTGFLIAAAADED